MSTYIKVDHAQLDNAANKIEDRIREHNDLLQQANGQVLNLETSFSGDDYIAYKLQWEKINDTNSTSSNMVKAMKEYADFLRYASSKYKMAQANAINRVNNIPIW